MGLPEAYVSANLAGRVDGNSSPGRQVLRFDEGTGGHLLCEGIPRVLHGCRPFPKGVSHQTVHVHGGTDLQRSGEQRR